METIEIRQNKKILLPFTALLVIALIGRDCYLFIARPVRPIYLQCLDLFFNFSLIYTVFIIIRNFTRRQAIITLTDLFIEINEKGKPILFNWPEITDIKVVNDDNTYFLVISASEKNKKVNISWLEKTPQQIDDLIKKFSK